MYSIDYLKGFLNEIFRILRPDGKLYLATDVSKIDEYHKKSKGTEWRGTGIYFRILWSWFERG